MKKETYAALFSTILGSCAPRYVPPPTLPSSIAEISTPKEVQEWLGEVLTYKHDIDLYKKKDFWAPCSLTYQNHAGDCEDYAICAAALLEKDVEKGYIIVLFGSVSKDEPRSSHAVFAYRLNNHWGIISNGFSEYRAPHFASLHEAVVDINSVHTQSERYLRYSIYDYAGVDLANGNDDLNRKMRKVGGHSLPP